MAVKIAHLQTYHPLKQFLLKTPLIGKNYSMMLEQVRVHLWQGHHPTAPSMLQ